MAVPLSDDERRRLEKLERDLAATDPELDLQLQSGSPTNAAARTVYGVLIILAGFAVVIAGIITQLPILGGTGFLIMVGGAHWFLMGLQWHPGAK
ncbi:DUF3040 domain-containing protein [Arthrobacter sp. FB24]|jgi:hypothetical protein|uniref:DUF3040 domain-containing protein n=1 Tax=Arthrobacter sp. (strain FB24) TaxID=290399 RepID=UPI001E2EA7DF|nr:DUF3040 domain-containing protein [Arthrobacter sp. FB24]